MATTIGYRRAAVPRLHLRRSPSSPLAYRRSGPHHTPRERERGGRGRWLRYSTSSSLARAAPDLTARCRRKRGRREGLRHRLRLPVPLRPLPPTAGERREWRGGRRDRREGRESEIREREGPTCQWVLQYFFCVNDKWSHTYALI
jgi:hypothetical protein